VTLWEVDIYPADGQPDLAGRRAAVDAIDLGLPKQLSIHAAHGYLLQGALSGPQVEKLARELLSDPVVEGTLVARIGEAA
jgi:phosphoribosylformylglycinamidine synthase subunit PurSL